MLAVASDCIFVVMCALLILIDTHLELILTSIFIHEDIEDLYPKDDPCDIMKSLSSSLSSKETH